MSAIVCIKCKSDVHELEVFPGPKCLNCHAAAFVMPTQAEVTNMWKSNQILEKDNA